MIAPQNESYSQWVRKAVARGRSAKGLLTPLFDSSVPEPRNLLAQLVSDAFAAPITPHYKSAFANGNPDVVEHLCRAYQVPASHVLCTTGATSALSQLYKGLVRPDQHVLVETPGFDLFQDIAHFHGLQVDTFARPAPSFDLDIDLLEAALKPNTKLVVVSNLHNPSGRVIPMETLLALAALAEARNFLVLADEVYGPYADKAVRPTYAAKISRRFISVCSLTKIFGLSTLRCGWIVASPSLLAPVRELSERVEFGISNLAHAAAALVFEHLTKFQEYSQDYILRTRPLTSDCFQQWGDEMLIEGELPPFGCIAFPRLVGIDDTRAFADWLCDRSGVIVAPGEYFGAPGHVRIGFAQPMDALKRGLEALDDGLRSYQRDRSIVAVS